MTVPLWLVALVVIAGYLTLRVFYGWAFMHGDNERAKRRYAQNTGRDWDTDQPLSLADQMDAEMARYERDQEIRRRMAEIMEADKQGVIWHDPDKVDKG